MTSIRDGRAGLGLGARAPVGPAAVLRRPTAAALCGLAAAALLALAGCTPALEWRELRADGRALVASFPCRPERRARSVALDGASLTVSMLSCSAGGNTYAIAFADVADPAAVTSGLDAWRQAATSNLGGAAPVADLAASAVPGMTPNAKAGRVRIDGRLPDGATVVEQAMFFVHGLRIYQASVLGPTSSDAAATPFFSGLRLVP